MKSTKEVSMSTVINSLPSADGFSMPGEFASHHGCLMIWPVRPGSWPFGGAAARKVFAQAAEAIADGRQEIADAKAEIGRASCRERV